MSSLSPVSIRAVPQQERASRRVATLLDAAAAIIADVGYEAMTMTAVAESAGASIGALYRYFPDKVALSEALHRRYHQELAFCWAPFVQKAGQLRVSEFAAALIDHMVEFVSDRPAYLILLAAPIKFPRDLAARKNLRDEFVAALRANNAALTPERAWIIANVAVQIVKGLIGVFADASPAQRDEFTHEFKELLTLYLTETLQAETP